MIKNMEEAQRDTALAVADLMATAARTAPKGSGKDKIISVIISGDDKARLAGAMHELAKKFDEAFIERDALNVENSHCVVGIGVVSNPFGLSNCGMCGYENCLAMKNAGSNCVFNITDLGIAIGSAVSVAADHRVDNRVMYSAGRGILAMGAMPDNVKVCYGIPLYTGAKSIYFDRGPGAVLL